MEDEYFESRGIRNPVIKYYPIIPKPKDNRQLEDDNASSDRAFGEKPVVSKAILVFKNPVKLADFDNKHVE